MICGIGFSSGELAGGYPYMSEPHERLMSGDSDYVRAI